MGRRKALVCILAASFLGATAAVLLFVAGCEDYKSSTPPTPAPVFKVLRQERPNSADNLQGGIEQASIPGTTKTSSTRRTLVQTGTASIEIEEARPVGEEPEITVQQADNGVTLAIFVYDSIAELDHTDLIQCYRDRNDGVPPWQDEHMEMAQNMGEIWMHRAMLSHPWRVLDPEEADLFYVPMYPVLSMKLALAGERPWLAKHVDKVRCGGLNHAERMDAAVEYLSRSSPFFNRFGGADHVLMCAWWDCRRAFGPRHRMLLRRTVIGINERLFAWTRWGCGPGRTVAVPYTASSVLTTPEAIGGRAAEDRDISFFFVGTARNRPERENLDIVKRIHEDSVILLGEHDTEWGMNATVYAEHIARSRFCFCPRGDSESSRRFFDAIAAGCIPIVTEAAVSVLPFSGASLNYSEFAVVVDKDAFKTREGVANVARDALSRSDADLAELRRGGRASTTSILYGVAEGPELSDMRPFLDPATKFLQASFALIGGREGRKESMWDCPDMNLPANILAPRTVKLPSKEGQTGHNSRRWLAESETIINVERSLLFCAPPNTGSLQFRMLAKRMQGIPHWSVHNNSSLLFDRAASGLDLLDLTDEPLLTKIYSDNGSGWIKIGVVRDPVTRLLSAYLDLVGAWRAACLLPPLPDDVQQASDRDRRQLLQLRQQVGSTEEERHRGQGRSQAPLASASGEWGLFDAIVSTRRRRQPGVGREGHAGYENNVSEGFRYGGGGGDGGINVNSSNNRMYLRRRHHVSQRLEQLQPQRRQLGDVKVEHAHHHKTDGHRTRFFWEGPGGWYGPGTVDATAGWAGREGKTNGDVAADNLDAVAGGGDGIHIPTFLEVVQALEADLWNAPAAFRPAASLCGQLHSPFDSVIPFERLQRTSTEVIKSLPGDIWETFGKSGWGPDGEHAFMEFDYGGGPRRTTDCALLDGESAADVQAGADTAQRKERNEDRLPRRSSDLYEGQESCAWVEYYNNMETLEAVGKLYEMDYMRYRWYRLDPWRERLKACLENDS